MPEQLHILTTTELNKVAEAAAAKAAERMYNDRWMRVKSVAVYADVHRSTVENWDIPFSKIGDVKVYRKTDVDNFLMNHRVKQAS